MAASLVVVRSSRSGSFRSLLALAMLAIFIARGEAQPSFSGAWGGPGSGPGQFQRPFGITHDDAGFVYVTDLDNHRVQKFTKDGVFVTSWGSAGSAPGQFQAPLGIAWSPLGEIVVVDHSSHRVSRFTVNGAHLGSFGAPGDEPGELLYPVAVATDLAGNIYVTESSNHRVQKFTPGGAFLAGWGGYGADPGQMIRPYGIVVEGTERVFVAEHGEHRVATDAGGHRVQRFTTGGAYELGWGSEGVADGQFTVAEGLALDGIGSLYVCDTDNHRLQRFTTDGEWVATWGESGVGAGQFQHPTDLTIDADGTFYVVDHSNHRVQKFGGTPIDLDHAPAIASVRDVPDDDGGQVFVRWTPSDLDAPEFRVVTGYRVWRRLPPDAVPAMRSERAAPDGSWDDGGRIVCARAGRDASGATSFWEAIATVPAERLEGYGIVAGTRQDSTRHGNPYTAFFVSALTTDPFVFHQSEIDSGYSVDNRPPFAPGPPQVTASAVGNVITWARSTAPDLAGYRLYRSAMPEFEPAAEWLIAEPNDTTHVDGAASGTSFYGVSAVDLRGNESPLVLAGWTLDAGPAAPRSEIQLGSPMPNPARRTPVRLRFDLPRAADVSVAVIDLQGRTVRTLAKGLAPAGGHETAWSGVDDSGRRASAGIYFIRLRAEGRERMQRVVWMP